VPVTANEPSKRLRSWARVTLEPGQHKTVQITLTAKDLADQHLLQYFDSSANAWKTPKGVFTVAVGGSFDTSLTDGLLVRQS
jgi:beta-glucosidase